MFLLLSGIREESPASLWRKSPRDLFPFKIGLWDNQKKKKSVQIRFATEIDFYFRLEKLYKKLKKDDRFFSWCGICAIIG